MKKRIVSIVLYSILLTAMLTAFVPAVASTITGAATKMPPTPTATLPPTPTQIPGVGPGGKIPVGIVLPSTGWSVYKQSRTSFINYLAKLGYSAPILLSNDSVAVEKTNVKSLIKQGIKVLIICSVEPWNAAEITNEAHAAGIKVIAYDRLIRDTSAVDYYVSFYGVSIGQAQAQYLVDHTNGKGIPLYLYAGSYNDNNAFLFFEGAWEVLQPKINDGTFVVKNSSFANTFKDKSILGENDKRTIVSGISIANWNQDEARSLARANLKAVKAEDKGDVAILAPNDGTARGIADIFANDKEITSYIITGQDADSLSLQYVRSGRQTMTVFKDTRVLAKDAIDAALAFLTDQTPLSTMTINNGATNIPFLPSGGVVVDKSNVDTFNK